MGQRLMQVEAGTEVNHSGEANLNERLPCSRQVTLNFWVVR